ncbi:hypothetical protein PFISCL1PPCAC_16135, partial [Pristionchus fissidentatus]
RVLPTDERERSLESIYQPMIDDVDALFKCIYIPFILSRQYSPASGRNTLSEWLGLHFEEGRGCEYGVRIEHGLISLVNCADKLSFHRIFAQLGNEAEFYAQRHFNSISEALQLVTMS